MRAEVLRSLTPEWSWDWIDTDSAIIESARIWQSAAYRLKWGPATRRLNALVAARVGVPYELIWVDKAVFLWPETVAMLRRAAERLIHYTPDAAFHTGNSRFFEQTMETYDLLVTTKAFEVDEYAGRAGKESVLLTTQGFDSRVHYPRNGPELRQKEVVFVGLAESDRMDCVETLLKHDIPVRVFGLGWRRFLRRFGDHPSLSFGGEGVFGEEYAAALSRSWIGLGLLSKRFPELHTTRTFEIPACGALLATERTSDTVRFFSDDEALFFDSHDELADKVSSMLAAGSSMLMPAAERGRSRVQADKRDYESILAGVMQRAGLL